MLRLEIGGGFADVLTAPGLVENIFQRKAFGLPPVRPVGSKEKVLGRLNDNEIAIYAAWDLAAGEVVSITAALNDDEVDEETKNLLRGQLEILSVWEIELAQLFHTTLPTRFADQITAEFDQIGIRDDFQVVTYRKPEEMVRVNGRILYLL
ncbi:MAG: hypothetical protein WCG73_01910 [Candidatus Moraniibacteriota bacterium]